MSDTLIQSLKDIVKNVNRNKRDNIYNIMVSNELAVQIARDLYLNNEIAINRKRIKAEEIQI